MNQLHTIGDYQYNPSFCLGEGAFGKVFKGIQITTKQTVAIKKINAAMINKDQYLKNSIQNEIQILKTLDHPNIVKFIEKFDSTNSIYIVTELCEDGDLKDLMKKAILSEEQILRIFCQLINGFKLLVEKNIIHRDLKPANILNHKGIVKIADFGFAKYIDNSSNQLLKTCVGSPLYMSPQILKREKYTSKSDIWSLGIIFYEMLFRRPPWNGHDENSLKKNVINQPLQLPSRNTLSDESKRFLIQALEKDEVNRITWECVFQLFDGVNKKYNIQPLYFQPIIQQSQIINRQKLQNQSFNNQMKVKNAFRLQLSFTYFVNVEMIQNLVLINQFYHKELHFEILCLLLAKLVSLQYQNFLEEMLNVVGEQGQTNNFKGYIDIILNESELAQELLRNTIDYFENIGKLEKIKLKSEEYQFIQGKESIQKLEQVVQKKIQILAQGISKFNGKIVNMPFEVLSLVDYILDTQITFNQINSNENINYREIHNKEKYRTDLEKYSEEIKLKVDKLYKW